MIAFPAGMRVWLAGGATDMRRGMNGLALQVQQGLGRDPHAGDSKPLPVQVKLLAMTNASPEVEALRTPLAAAEARAAMAEARAAEARAMVSGNAAVIATLKLEIEKLKRALYGQNSERRARLLDQLELRLEELEAAATEDELDVTETLEVIPRQWKVIQTVREKFTCRDCERITQPPAPFHPTPRGWAGPSLLAMSLFEKFGQHQPLNRQAERYAREGVDLSLSTLADQVGACAAALATLHALIEAHVMAAERLHGDDTTVPVLAKGKTAACRAVPLLPRPQGRASRTAPQALVRHAAGRRLCRLPRALRRRPKSRPDPRGAVLEPRKTQVLRARRHRRERPKGQGRTADLTHRAGGDEAHRRDLRPGARHQRHRCRGTPRRAPAGCHAARRRSRAMAAH
jgi:transposase